MSDNLRLLGSDNIVRVTMNNTLQRTITAIESMSITLNVQILEKEYLGKTTVTLDEIFKGASWELQFDPESTEFLKVNLAVRDRSSRRVANGAVRINIATTMNFPNGQRPRILLPDVKFDPIAMNQGGRDQYLSNRWSGKVENVIASGV